jgi:hypothetical protein
MSEEIRTQPAVYDYLTGQSEGRTSEQIATALGFTKMQINSALTNLKKKGCVETVGNIGNASLWAMVPGAPYDGRAVGGNGAVRVRAKSNNPAVIRFRAALDELMDAFIALEPLVVSEGEIKALEQMRLVAKRMAGE